MEYLLIGLFLVVVISAVLLYYMKKKTDNKGQDSLGVISARHSFDVAEQTVDMPYELDIQFEMLPVGTMIDESRLVEIKSNKVLAHVNNLVPQLAQVGNTANNAFQAIQRNGEVLYRAIIPSGAKLSNSSTTKNAVRGFYRGAKGIRGHADFVEVARNGADVVANNFALAMNVASMVVGQYYMAQINAKLDQINESISRISSFQNNEYRSRVFSLIAHVKKIADFQIEILENNELRLSKISQLNNLEEECTQLLGQANLTLAGYAEKRGINYQTYEKELKDAQNWYAYQEALFEVMHEISDLRYTLHLGTVSREQCLALLLVYKQQVIDTQTRLTKWHQEALIRLNIDLNESRRKRDGIDGIIHFFPSLIKKELKSRTIENNVANIIKEQIHGYRNSYEQDQSELYLEDVQLIAMDGKIYYLPEIDA